MTYNLTNVTDSNTIVDIATNVNILSGHIFFALLLLILFLTFAVVFKKQNFKTVLLADSFFISIIAAIMFTFGWISSQILIVPIVLLLASLIIYYFVVG